jgi:hypothetical protein
MRAALEAVEVCGKTCHLLAAAARGGFFASSAAIAEISGLMK